MTRRNSGFTLIELMIVVLVIGILAAIAYPSYARYVEQARRADGKSALLDAAQRLERCHTQNNTYANCMVFPVTSPDGFYSVDATVMEPMAFTLTAAPQGAQAASPCETYSLASNGVRGVTGTLGADRCW